MGNMSEQGVSSKDGESFEFFCLSRDISQRKMIARVLRREGKVRWILVRPISLRRYEEARSVAERALTNAATQPSGKLTRAFKLWHLRAQYAGARRLFERRKSAVAVAWGSITRGRLAFMEGARAGGGLRLYLEHSPIPGRITVDPRGVHANSSLPRNIEPYLRWADNVATDRKRWREAQYRIKQRTRVKVGTRKDNLLPPLEEPFLFAPLQVPSDAFVNKLVSVAGSLPDGWHLRLKDHPSARMSASQSLRLSGQGQVQVYLDNDNDTFTQVAASRGVVTVNSSVGMQAFYFDKPVVVCGQTFWNIPGIAIPAPDVDSLKNVFSTPEALCFDEDARDAFMTYLSTVYFPAIDKAEAPEAASIAERLAGTDEYGFWNVE